MIKTTVLADSFCDVQISKRNARILTLQLEYPRSIHSEMMTHRVFSRNAASSRAVPISKTIAAVDENPFFPLHWGRNQKGMQAGEPVSESAITLAKTYLMEALDNAVMLAEELADLGLHKQIVNRYLEPFSWYTAIFTGTIQAWYGFLLQRNHHDAEPHIRDLAVTIDEAIRGSVPRLVNHGQWHLPLIFDEDWDLLRETPLEQLGTMPLISAARCARVSYLTHEGKRDLTEDFALFLRLINQNPGHWSPLEHPRMVTSKGWSTLRSQYWNEYPELPLVDDDAYATLPENYVIKS